MQVYTNVFEGYTTNFVVADPSGDPPGISHECVIEFENTPSLEIVIPYFRDLEPWQMKRDLELLLERAEEIRDSNEEYPFRCLPAIEEQSSFYRTRDPLDNNLMMYVYWHPQNSRARVRVLTSGDCYLNALKFGIGFHKEYLQQVTDNIRYLLKTMKY